MTAGPIGPPLRPDVTAFPQVVAASEAAPLVAPAELGFPDGRSGGVLAVSGPLAEILPKGGLPRGGVVSLTGDSGVTSLLFGLLAGPPQTWAALVGMPGLGLLAAAELGVDLAKVVVVPDPGPDVLQILSILADGVDLIAVAAPAGPLAAPGRLRVLLGRLRQRGAVLLVAGTWPGADLVLTTRMGAWGGLGAGHGRLRDRTLEVQVSGRGSAGRGRHGVLLLKGSGSGVELHGAAAALGSDVHRSDSDRSTELVADAG